MINNTRNCEIKKRNVEVVHDLLQVLCYDKRDWGGWKKIFFAVHAYFCNIFAICGKSWPLTIFKGSTLIRFISCVKLI